MKIEHLSAEIMDFPYRKIRQDLEQKLYVNM